MSNDQNPAGSREHELKCWPGPYDATAAGDKPFEFRINDRNFHIGDTLVLRRWNPDRGEYTGQRQRVRVTYVCGGRFGIPDGYVVMGIKPEASENPAGSPTARTAREMAHEHERATHGDEWCCFSGKHLAERPHSYACDRLTAAIEADRAQRSLEVERLQKQCEHFMAECKARGEETLALRERLEMSEASATFAHERSAGLTLDLDRERARAEAAEGMLERAVKYATEDRAITPGSTRLARLMDEIRRHLSQASPQKERTGEARCHRLCGNGVVSDGCLIDEGLPCYGDDDKPTCYCTEACREARKPLHPSPAVVEAGPSDEPDTSPDCGEGAPDADERGHRPYCRQYRKPAHPGTKPGEGAVPDEECNQCGAKQRRAERRHAEDDRCPDHASPIASCDGTMQPITPAAQPVGGEERFDDVVCTCGWRGRPADLVPKMRCQLCPKCSLIVLDVPATPAPPQAPVGAPTLVECTGLAAQWCPNCGDCKCLRFQNGERDHENPNGCPLHKPTSKHAEPAPQPMRDWAAEAVAMMRKVKCCRYPQNPAAPCDWCLFLAAYEAAHPIGRPEEKP